MIAPNRGEQPDPFWLQTAQIASPFGISMGMDPLCECWRFHVSNTDPLPSQILSPQSMHPMTKSLCPTVRSQLENFKVSLPPNLIRHFADSLLHLFLIHPTDSPRLFVKFSGLLQWGHQEIVIFGGFAFERA